MFSVGRSTVDDVRGTPTVVSPLHTIVKRSFIFHHYANRGKLCMLHFILISQYSFLLVKGGVPLDLMRPCKHTTCIFNIAFALRL